MGREDTLYEAYLGTEEEKTDEVPKRISCMDMFRIAKEDRLNFDIESFKEALYGAIENAEEEDVSMYELADLAVEYVEKKL